MSDLEIVRFSDPKTLEAVKRHEATKDAFMTEVQPGQTVTSLGLVDYESYNNQQYAWQKYDVRGIHTSRGMAVIYMPHNIKGSRARDFQKQDRHDNWGNWSPIIDRQLEVLKKLPNLEKEGLKWVLPRAAEVIQVFRNHIKQYRDSKVREDEGLFWFRKPPIKIPWGFDHGDHMAGSAYMEALTTDRLGVSDYQGLRTEYLLVQLVNSLGKVEIYLPHQREIDYYTGVFAIGVPIEIPE